MVIYMNKFIVCVALFGFFASFAADPKPPVGPSTFMPTFDNLIKTA